MLIWFSKKHAHTLSFGYSFKTLFCDISAYGRCIFSLEMDLGNLENIIQIILKGK